MKIYKHCISPVSIIIMTYLRPGHFVKKKGLFWLMVQDQGTVMVVLVDKMPRVTQDIA